MWWVLAACGGDGPSTGAGDDDDDIVLTGTPTGSESGFTWYEDVWPVARDRCVSCHSAGGIAPLDFEDPAVVEAQAGLIVSDVVSRRMPPWGMDPACREVPGSLWLSDEDLRVFTDWRNAGYAMGDPDDAEPGTTTPTHDPGPPDLVLMPDGEYDIGTADVDDYRCIPVGEVLEDELFVRGIRTEPQNRAVAHHILLHVAPPDQVDLVEELDAADPGPGYSCVGFTGLDNDSTIGGWAPGRGPLFQPEGVAQRIPKGSRLVMQMHYNTLAVSGDPGTDRTPAELWLYDGVPDKVMIAYPVVHFGLEVPAGEPRGVTRATQRLAVNGDITRSSPHMHSRGLAMHTELFRADSSYQCLSQVDRWDFDWQYIYDAPPGVGFPVSIEDEVEVTCTFDNEDNPDTLVWGEGYETEMCLDYLGIEVPWEGGTTGGVCSGYPVCDQKCDADDPYCSLQCMTGSGDSCLFCGLGALLSPCLTSQCGPVGLTLSRCMDVCDPKNDFENTIGCLYDDCRPSLNAYWACAKPALESGACAATIDGCAELAKP